eukprot:12922062-Prorocentrum_lima.AAC.1
MPHSMRRNLESSLFNSCHACQLGELYTRCAVEVEQIPVLLEMCAEEMEHQHGMIAFACLT